MITVQAIHLQITASPTTIFAGTCALQVRVEVRDDAGNLVPGYRGTIGFTSTSAQSGLPTIGLGQLGYTFTAADARAHEWTGIMLHNAGSHTITGADGTRQATSNAITVNEVFFRVGLSPDHVYNYDRDLTLTVDVVDAAGQVVAGYCGSIDFSSTAGVIGLLQGSLSLPDYTFTAADAGQITIPNLAFTEAGDQSITVSDHANASRQTTSPSVHTTPPEPEPQPAGPQPDGYAVPSATVLPQPFLYHWGMPFRAISPVDGLNHWKGYPSRPWPADPGTMYIVSGMAQRMPGA
jgi:hypothetical protein